MKYLHKRSILTISAILSLALLLTACSESKLPDREGIDAGSMGKLLGNKSGGFTPVLPGKNITFPADHQAHEGFRQEWWYLTANLTTEQGNSLGLQWTQFRIALSPADNSSKQRDENRDWATDQLYMAHSAVTTESSHLASERWSRSHPQLAGVNTAPFSVKLDNWKWQSQGEALFPASLTVSDNRFAYQLNLSSDSPYQLQGEKGFSIKSLDGSVASYYYSQPFIEVEGWVTPEKSPDNGGVSERQKVSGKAWLDREWSSQFLNRSQQGWDWFSLRLNDGSALMLFQLRGEQNFYSARRMFADGSGHNVESGMIQMSAIDWHQIGDNRYPVSWKIAIPSEQIEITTHSLNPNANMALSVNYWEGPINIQGSHSGEGYMELTGY
ncbi:lipocalin-like domain-containing protein [Shewanella atlantica]|uniref:Carotenoid 1,2-hydratase n=1 Tax=Shewanella atlantica TaxID=271099 RepID=A0A3S0IDZ1_9GAMM|nr:lipocalin-like domain-containing protein [Shewanella atlantica]RTR31613.1 carotenoid 1,2-hydratase [Shewanella atlantica]